MADFWLHAPNGRRNATDDNSRQLLNLVSNIHGGSKNNFLDFELAKQPDLPEDDHAVHTHLPSKTTNLGLDYVYFHNGNFTSRDNLCYICKL